MARIVKGISLPTQYFQPEQYEHLHMIKGSLRSGNMKPSIIIGQDNYHLLAPIEIIEGYPNATRTVLGWSIHGSLCRKSRHGVTNAYTMHMYERYDNNEWKELDNVVKQSYALDTIGVMNMRRLSTKDTGALILDETFKKVGENREVILPWKNGSDKMKYSYPTAFQGIQRKMCMKTDFQADYHERVQHLLENVYVHLCNDPDVLAVPNRVRVCYLLDFAVENPNKEKLRQIFAAAAKSQGYTLNDYLQQGPDLLVSLFGILMSFIEHRVAVAGDIIDMFLRVHVRKKVREIRNWSRNSKIVLDSLPQYELGPSTVKFIIEGTSVGERTLESYWYPADDSDDTNLQGAFNELKACQTTTYSFRFNWLFNPPLSPHMGGACERLIRSVKVILKVILKEREPRDETFTTLLCKVEAIVNSRPLTQVSVDPCDVSALTPLHFIIVTSSNLPISSTTSADLCSRKQWRVAQRLADMFWARWLKEVLPCLLPRPMIHTSDKNQLCVGDIVLVVDPNSERNHWPRGIVEVTHPGADGRVRVVDVRTARGVLRRRSVLRVVRLPFSSGGEAC